MAESLLSSPEKPFSSPHEEIAFLRSELAKKESLVTASSAERLKTEKEIIGAYGEMPVAAVIAPERVISKETAEAIVLKLSPEAHDRKIEELLSILQEKGLKNTLTILDKLDKLSKDEIAKELRAFLSEESTNELLELMKLSGDWYKISKTIKVCGDTQKIIEEFLNYLKSLKLGIRKPLNHLEK